MMRVTLRHEGGASMLEVLITIVISAIGLLGLGALQSRMTVAQTEAYQRAQAITLLESMVARVHADRKNAMSFVTSTPLGTGGSVQDCAGKTGAAAELCEWNNALLGAAEATDSGSKAGAMTGARGCIRAIQATPPQTLSVEVVWQGYSDTVAPASTSCGSGSYGSEKRRRALVAQVTLACLQNDAAGACVWP